MTRLVAGLRKIWRLRLPLEPSENTTGRRIESAEDQASVEVQK